MKLFSCIVVLFAALFVGLPAKKAEVSTGHTDPMFFCDEPFAALCRKNIHSAAYISRLPNSSKPIYLCSLLEDCQEVQEKCTTVPMTVTDELCNRTSSTTPTTTQSPATTTTLSTTNQVPEVPSTVSKECVEKLKKNKLPWLMEIFCRLRDYEDADQVCEIVQHKTLFPPLVDEIKKKCTPQDANHFKMQCEDFAVAHNCSTTIYI